MIHIDRLPRGLLVLAASALVSATPAAVAAQTEDSTTMQRGRELTRLFYAGQMDSIVPSFNAQMREALGKAGVLAGFREQLALQLGTEQEVVEERIVTVAPHRVYLRTARFANFGGRVAVTWAFDVEGRVAGFQVRPEQAAPQEAPTRHLDYQTRARLRLPFDGEWTVVWGGRTVAQNYHAAHLDQRFAYDILIMRDGSTHAGDGRTNEQYHCFGKGLLAPAAGTIAAARDGVPDNAPGVLNDAAPTGNHVVIDHGNAEFSFLAHLRQGSLRVAAGDRVEAGQPLGECGNSGRSSEPHLHYHLQDTSVFGRGEGLPAIFNAYFADDARVERGEPVQGQRVRDATAGPQANAAPRR